MKKFAIYTPYLDSFGGGERYCLTLAETVSRIGKVDILIDSHLKNLNPKELIRVSEARFNLDLSKVNLVNAPFGAGSSALKRMLFLRKYDFLFYVTDGSIFYSSAKKNILHMQSPFKCIYKHSLKGRVKLKSWDLVVYNSKFTQNNAESEWPLPSVVIYPPVDIKAIKPLKKEKIILNVGRFSGYLKDKKQDLLIEEFKKIHPKIKEWSFYLVGSAAKGDMSFVEELKKAAKGFPIKVLENYSYNGLVELFGKASIYWHAKGYEETDPNLMEHFGITTVEAMAGGCVPAVINRGGQVEIVSDSGAGELWNGLDELGEKTLELVSNVKLREEMSKKGIELSKKFSKENFAAEVLKITNG